MEHEYLVMKLGNIKGIDYYKEHTKVIQEFGYVDFARVGRRFLAFSFLNEPFFYIKESAGAGNRIFKASIMKDLSGEKRTPEYYNSLDLSKASWVRIAKMEIINKDKFLAEHTLRNGEEIKALNRGAVTFFYIIDRKQD